jgi:leader peptidase (prepilin peptidase)/N-methyltransferase
VDVALVIVFGLVIGSFLNVCIARVPHGESIVSPPSHCPLCQTQIAWYDNVPVLSYVILRGHCRGCSAWISPRYPLVEVLTAIALFLVYRLDLPPREFVVAAAFTFALIVITFIDVDHKIIPDVITLPSILIAPAAAYFVGHISMVDSIGGILAGGGGLWAIAAAYEYLRKQEGMGFGDVKFLAMVGGFQGWEGAVFTLIVGSLIGTIIGIGVMIARRGRLDMEIPFGPFLAAGSYLYLLGGPELVGWYLSLPASF